MEETYEGTLFIIISIIVITNDQNLQNVNDYIRDAKHSLDANPNDDEARRALMDAYQEKAMLFELALDRSLP